MLEDIWKEIFDLLS